MCAPTFWCALGPLRLLSALLLPTETKRDVGRIARRIMILFVADKGNDSVDRMQQAVKTMAINAMMEYTDENLIQIRRSLLLANTS